MVQSNVDHFSWNSFVDLGLTNFVLTIECLQCYAAHWLPDTHRKVLLDRSSWADANLVWNDENDLIGDFNRSVLHLLVQFSAFI